MRKLSVLVAITALMLLVLAAAAMPVGHGDTQPTAFRGEHSIEIHGAQATFDGILQEP